MAYDLSELKNELTILIENLDRVMAYEDNNDISEELRSRIKAPLEDIQTQLGQLEDEIEDGIYEKDAPMYYDDERDEDDGEDENYYY